MYAMEETGDTRPFKIFVSLLDRWEIGGPVTEALVIDALTALRNAMERAPDNDDVGLKLNKLLLLMIFLTAYDFCEHTIRGY
jgi:hypothetical protein